MSFRKNFNSIILKSILASFVLIQSIYVLKLKNQGELDAFFKFDMTGKIDFTPFQIQLSDFKIKFTNDDSNNYKCGINLIYVPNQNLDLVYRKIQNDKEIYVTIDDYIVRFKKNSQMSHTLISTDSEEQCSKFKKIKKFS